MEDSTVIDDTAHLFCGNFIDVLSGHGVKEFVCSPGSRNAPLLLALSARGELHKHVVIDERSAAFMALGMAMVSRRPVGLVCTSGSAVLNYAPALAEAYYQGIPLIVISADRPEQWIDQDDSQTIRQFGVLENIVKRSYEIPALGQEDPEMQWYVNRIANDSWIEATSGKPGPVHVNIRLNEPLGLKCRRLRDCRRLIEELHPDGFVSRLVMEGLARKGCESKIMVVAGFMPPDNKMNKAVARLVRLPNVVVMAETLSNLHLGEADCCVDSVLTAYEPGYLDCFAPDLVISFGGALVSRKLKEYLRRNSKRVEHWAVGESRVTSDCFMSLTKRIDMEPQVFIHGLALFMERNMRKMQDSPCNGYSLLWRKLREDAKRAKQRFVAECGWCELKAFEKILSWLPKEWNLFLSNGTSVRYAQLFPEHLPHASYCNRGVSGIDGSVSTAVGGASMYKGKSLLITGDMSMAYDVGALSLPGITDGFQIVVIDNSGGGIFRFIPSTSGLEEREKYFCSSPVLPLRELASGYGWDYSEARDGKELESSLEKIRNAKKKGILRVVCPPDYSAGVLKGYMASKAIL